MRGLVALFLIALVARVLYLELAEPVPTMQGITRKYQVLAENFLGGQGFVLKTEPDAIPFVERPPGYVVVLATAHLLAGPRTQAQAHAHAALASLHCVLVALLGTLLLGRRVGWLAGAMVALWPPFWRADVQVLATGACGVAIAFLALCLARQVKKPGRLQVAWLAVAATLPVLLRPDNLLLPPLCFAVCLALAPRGERRARALTLLPVLLVPLLVLIPWGLRNARVSGEGFFVSVGLGNTLLQGYGEGASGPDAPYGDAVINASEGAMHLTWPNPVARDEARKARALGLIRENPGTWMRSCLRRFPILLSLHAGELWPGGPGLRDYVKQWREEHPGRPRYEGLVRAAFSYLAQHPVRAAATLIWGPALMLLAAAGLILLGREGKEKLLLFSLPVYGVLIHVPLHAEPRYFIPFAGILCVPAALALQRLLPSGRSEAAL